MTMWPLATGELLPEQCVRTKALLLISTEQTIDTLLPQIHTVRRSQSTPLPLATFSAAEAHHFFLFCSVLDCLFFSC
jgi:predicted membrane chloride channel (bestrophin family)